LKITLQKNNLIRIFGPALINVAEGKICILGKIYGKGDKAIIHRMRSYALLALEDSVLEVNLGSGGVLQEPEPNEEPLPEWLDFAEKIINEQLRKIIVLGPIDSGKSSVAVLLANMALNKGIKPVAIIDSDVGQADIGPPAFISVAKIENTIIWMRELKPAIMKFIGDIRPQYYVDKIINNVLDLLNRSFEKLKCKLVIIDTDGWIQDMYAIEYKFKLIERISPDAIIVLGKEYYNIFKRFEKLGIKVYELKTPLVVKTRSRDERRKLRSEQYKKFLEESPVRRYELDNVVVLGNPLFEGEEVDVAQLSSTAGVPVLYATRLPDSIHMVVQQGNRNIQLDKIKESYGVNKVRYYVQGFEKGLYVALTDQDDSDYPGLIEGIDYANKIIHIRTSFEGYPKIIKFSRIRLTKEFLEQLIIE